MGLLTVMIRLLVTIAVVIPRLYRTMFWRLLNTLRVPLIITAPLGAAAAATLFWAPLALLVPFSVPPLALVAVWGAVTLGAVFSAVRWLLVEVEAGRI